MQNTVTELSHRLLRSLDNNYNVIDMPAVVEIISALERTSITEELLKTTRLGKYINELRRKTSNEALAKRAKDLLKKWRDQVLPTPATNTANGTGSSVPKTAALTFSNDRSNSPDLNLNRINATKRPNSSLDDSNSRKRGKLNGRNSRNEIFISDNSLSNSLSDLKRNQNLSSCNSIIIVNSDSNSSSHGVLDRVPPLEDTNLTFSGRNLGRATSNNDGANPSPVPKQQQKSPSLATTHLTDKPEPKKRGRKKGSKNHKTLLVQAEESFTNKMAVSVNAKVKTTRELLASIQNKNYKPISNIFSNPIIEAISPKLRSIEGVSSPKVTLEGVVKNDKSKSGLESRSFSPVVRNENKFSSVLIKRESDSPIHIDLDSENSRDSINDSNSITITRVKREASDENEIIDVVDSVSDEPQQLSVEPKVEPVESIPAENTVEGIRAQLPKVDYSFVYEENPEPPCTCVLLEPAVKNENITIEFHENATGGSIFDVPETVPSSIDDPGDLTRAAIVPNPISVPEVQFDPNCQAKSYYETKFHLSDGEVTPARVDALHTRFLDSINGNKCEKTVNQRNCDVNNLNADNDGGGGYSSYITKHELFSNIVPNFHAGEIIKKDITLESLNYIKHKKIILYPLVSGDNNRTKCCDQSDSSHCTCCQLTSESDRVSSSPLRDDGSNHITSFNSHEINDSPDGDGKHPVSSRPDSANADLLTEDNFREFHECISVRSYNDELLHILPYVVLD